ncbi:ATP-binding protein [soil metagenome]
MWSTAVSQPEDLWTLRREVSAILEEHRLDEVADVALLLVTELASNALRHGTGPRTAHVVVTGRQVRIEVLDASPVLPRLLGQAPACVGGNGMRLVDALATRWGVEVLPAGKAVWFELAA